MLKIIPAALAVAAIASPADADVVVDFSFGGQVTGAPAGSGPYYGTVTGQLDIPPGPYAKADFSFTATGLPAPVYTATQQGANVAYEYNYWTAEPDGTFEGGLLDVGLSYLPYGPEYSVNFYLTYNPDTNYTFGDFDVNDGYDYDFNGPVSFAIPEPRSITVFAVGLTCLILARTAHKTNFRNC